MECRNSVHLLISSVCPPSVHIDNPVLYEQFQQGELGDGAKHVCFFPSAHPNILLEPKKHWNASSAILMFSTVDFHYNHIHLYTHDRHAVGLFYEAYDLLAGFPDNYDSYKLDFRSNAVFSDNDLDVLLTWKTAKQLDIAEDSGIAEKLYRRLDEFEALDNLEVLKLTIHPYSVDRIALKPFFEVFPRLRRVDFRFVRFTPSAIENFVDEQHIPANFRKIVSTDANSVAYLRRV